MSLMKYFKSKDTVNQQTQVDHEEELSDQESLNSCDDDIWDSIIDEEIERQRKLMKTYEMNNVNRQQKKSSNPEKKQPKRKRTAYLFYTSTMRSKVSIQHQGLPPSEITRILANNWRNLSDEERAPYIQRALEDQSRWENEKLDYLKNSKDETDDKNETDASKDQTKKRGRKKREKKWTKDPDAPKKALSPYIIYGQMVRPEVMRKLKETDNCGGGNIMKYISYQWNNMSKEEKEEYEDIAKSDRERYEKEKYEYDLKKNKAITPQTNINFITENVGNQQNPSISNDELMVIDSLKDMKDTFQPRFQPPEFHHHIPLNPPLMNGHLKPIFDANLLQPLKLINESRSDKNESNNNNNNNNNNSVPQPPQINPMYYLNQN